MTKLFYTIFSLLFLVACSSEITDEKQTETEELTTSLIDEKVAADLEGLTLNDGQKWKADRSTDKGMKNVQQMLNDFNGEDTQQLGADIKDSLNTVIKKCDFKGEDHEQYHIILHAMLKDAKRLKRGKTSDLSKMKAYIQAYNNHFEIGDLE